MLVVFVATESCLWLIFLGNIPAKQFSDSFPVTGAGKVVHEEIHRGTRVKTELRDCQQHGKRVGIAAVWTEPGFEDFQ